MKKLLPLYLVIFIAFLGISMSILIFTVMTLNLDLSPLPKSTPFWMRNLLFGVLTAAYPLGQFLGSPILGALSDRYGRRPILLWTLLLTTIGYIFVSLSLQTVAIAAICITLFIVGLFEANVVIAQGAIADVSDQTNRAARFGYISVVASTAYIIGPIFGGDLSNPKFVSWFSYATPYWALTLLFVPLLTWIYFAFKETHPENKRIAIKWAAAITNMKDLFCDKEVRKLYLVNFLAYNAMYGFFRLYPLYVTSKYQPTLSLISYIIAYVAIPIIIVNAFLIKPLTKKFKEHSLYLFSLWAVAITNVLIVLFGPFEWIWLTTFLTGLAVSIGMTLSISVISHKVNGQKQGRVLGNNTSLMVIPQVTMGLIGGALSVAWLKLPLIFCGLCAALAALILRSEK